MALRFKVRAHTTVSSADRWSWVEGFLDTPLGALIMWTINEQDAAICEGLDDAQGNHIPDPSREQMAESLRQWRERFEVEGDVWGLEFVYLDGEPS